MERLPGWLQRLVEIGALPSDSEEVAAPQGGAGPVVDADGELSRSSGSRRTPRSGSGCRRRSRFAYQLASAASIDAFARTHRYALFRRSQLRMSLLLPFALQWSLGGFENSSAVCLWGFTSPLGALLFGGRAPGGPLVRSPSSRLVVVSAAIDSALAAGAPDIPHGVVDRVLRAQHPRRRDDRVRAAAVLRPRARAGADGAARTSTACARARAGEVRAPAAQRPARSRSRRG